MVTSAGVDKTLLATMVERMDCEFEFSQKMEQWEKRFQGWRCGGSIMNWNPTRPLATWTVCQNNYWIRRPSSCCKCASWTKGVNTFRTQVGPTRMRWLNWEIIDWSRRGEMIRRKYELKQKHVYKLCDKQLKKL